MEAKKEPFANWSAKDAVKRPLPLSSIAGAKLQCDVAATNFDTNFTDRYWRLDAAFMVDNDRLQARFTDFRDEQLKLGRPIESLNETLLFSYESERTCKDICQEGQRPCLRRRHVLGHTGSGVHLVRHYDILTRYMAYQNTCSPSFVIIYKAFLGKSKPIVPRLHKDDNFVSPASGFDSHVSARPVEASMTICEALNCSFVYLYEYDEVSSNTVRHPRHILPFAIFHLEKKVPLLLENPLLAVARILTSSDWEVKGETRRGFRFVFKESGHKGRHKTFPSQVKPDHQKKRLKEQLVEMRTKPNLSSCPPILHRIPKDNGSVFDGDTSPPKLNPEKQSSPKSIRSVNDGDSTLLSGINIECIKCTYDQSQQLLSMRPVVKLKRLRRKRKRKIKKSNKCLLKTTIDRQCSLSDTSAHSNRSQKGNKSEQYCGMDCGHDESETSSETAAVACKLSVETSKDKSVSSHRKEESGEKVVPDTSEPNTVRHLKSAGEFSTNKVNVDVEVGHVFSHIETRNHLIRSRDTDELSMAETNLNKADDNKIPPPRTASTAVIQKKTHVEKSVSPVTAVSAPQMLNMDPNISAAKVTSIHLEGSETADINKSVTPPGEECRTEAQSERRKDEKSLAKHNIVPSVVDSFCSATEAPLGNTNSERIIKILEPTKQQELHVDNVNNTKTKLDKPIQHTKTHSPDKVSSVHLNVNADKSALKGSANDAECSGPLSLERSDKRNLDTSKQRKMETTSCAKPNNSSKSQNCTADTSLCTKKRRERPRKETPPSTDNADKITNEPEPENVKSNAASEKNANGDHSKAISKKIDKTSNSLLTTSDKTKSSQKKLVDHCTQPGKKAAENYRQLTVDEAERKIIEQMQSSTRHESSGQLQSIRTVKRSIDQNDQTCKTKNPKAGNSKSAKPTQTQGKVNDTIANIDFLEKCEDLIEGNMGKDTFRFNTCASIKSCNHTPIINHDVTTNDQTKLFTQCVLESRCDQRFTNSNNFLNHQRPLVSNQRNKSHDKMLDCKSSLENAKSKLASTEVVKGLDSSSHSTLVTKLKKSSLQNHTNVYNVLDENQYNTRGNPSPKVEKHTTSLVVTDSQSIKTTTIVGTNQRNHNVNYNDKDCAKRFSSTSKCSTTCEGQLVSPVSRLKDLSSLCKPTETGKFQSQNHTTTIGPSQSKSDFEKIERFKTFLGSTVAAAANKKKMKTFEKGTKEMTSTTSGNDNAKESCSNATENTTDNLLPWEKVVLSGKILPMNDISECFNVSVKKASHGIVEEGSIQSSHSHSDQTVNDGNTRTNISETRPCRPNIPHEIKSSHLASNHQALKAIKPEPNTVSDVCSERTIGDVSKKKMPPPHEMEEVNNIQTVSEAEISEVEQIKMPQQNDTKHAIMKTLKELSVVLQFISNSNARNSTENDQSTLQTIVPKTIDTSLTKVDVKKEKEDTRSTCCVLDDSISNIIGIKESNTKQCKTQLDVKLEPLTVTESCCSPMTIDTVISTRKEIPGNSINESSQSNEDELPRLFDRQNEPDITSIEDFGVPNISTNGKNDSLTLSFMDNTTHDIKVEPSVQNKTLGNVDHPTMLMPSEIKKEQEVKKTSKESHASKPGILNKGVRQRKNMFDLKMNSRRPRIIGNFTKPKTEPHLSNTNTPHSNVSTTAFENQHLAPTSSSVTVLGTPIKTIITERESGPKFNPGFELAEAPVDIILGPNCKSDREFQSFTKTYHSKNNSVPKKCEQRSNRLKKEHGYEEENPTNKKPTDDLPIIPFEQVMKLKRQQFRKYRFGVTNKKFIDYKEVRAKLGIGRRSSSPRRSRSRGKSRDSTEQHFSQSRRSRSIKRRYRKRSLSRCSSRSKSRSRSPHSRNGHEQSTKYTLEMLYKDPKQWPLKRTLESKRFRGTILIEDIEDTVRFKSGISKNPAVYFKRRKSPAHEGIKQAKKKKTKFAKSGTGFFSWKRKYQPKKENAAGKKTGLNAGQIEKRQRIRQRESLRKQIEQSIREYRRTFEEAGGDRKGDSKVASFLQYLTGKLEVLQMKTDNLEKFESGIKGKPASKEPYRHRNRFRASNNESVYDVDTAMEQRKSVEKHGDSIDDMLKEHLSRHYEQMTKRIKEQLMRQVTQDLGISIPILDQAVYYDDQQHKEYQQQQQQPWHKGDNTYFDERRHTNDGFDDKYSDVSDIKLEDHSYDYEYQSFPQECYAACSSSYEECLIRQNRSRGPLLPTPPEPVSNPYLPHGYINETENWHNKYDVYEDAYGIHPDEYYHSTKDRSLIRKRSLSNDRYSDFSSRSGSTSEKARSDKRRYEGSVSMSCARESNTQVPDEFDARKYRNRPQSANSPSQSSPISASVKAKTVNKIMPKEMEKDRPENLTCDNTREISSINKEKKTGCDVPYNDQAKIEKALRYIKESTESKPNNENNGDEKQLPPDHERQPPPDHERQPPPDHERQPPPDKEKRVVYLSPLRRQRGCSKERELSDKHYERHRRESHADKNKSYKNTDNTGDLSYRYRDSYKRRVFSDSRFIERFDEIDRIRRRSRDRSSPDSHRNEHNPGKRISEDKNRSQSPVTKLVDYDYSSDSGNSKDSSTRRDRSSEERGESSYNINRKRGSSSGGFHSYKPFFKKRFLPGNYPYSKDRDRRPYNKDFKYNKESRRPYV